MVLAGSPFSAGSTSSAFNNFPTMLRTAKTTLLANGNTTFVVNPVTGTVTPGTSIFDFARSDLIVDPKRQKLMPNPDHRGEQMTEEY